MNWLQRIINILLYNKNTLGNRWISQIGIAWIAGRTDER